MTDEIGLSVIDDGIGFTLPSGPDLLTRDRRLGLVGMLERATQAGGNVRILTNPGEGTRVITRLPALACDPS